METTQSKATFTLFILFAINTLNFFDRQVPGAVAEPIRKALDLTDEKLGWVTTAFVLLYAAVGMPLGHWADVGRRKLILAGGVLLWSVFTFLSGLAWDFWSLFVLRLGVGVGEASCAPAGNSLLGDLFPKEKRGRAIAVFMLGLPLGLGLSSIVSGWVAKHLEVRTATLRLEGWQLAFWIAGLPGLVFALLCLFMVEPARGGADQHHAGPVRWQTSPWLGLLRIRTLWWLIISGVLHNFNMYAIGAFLSPYLQRFHGRTVAEAGQISGIVYCFGGLGILLGGWACDWMVRRRISGRLEVGSLALLVGGPCVYLALQQPAGSYWAFSAWLLPGCLMFYVYYSAVYASIQDIVEPALRGKAMALYFCAMYFLGAALGPVATGRLSDFCAQRAALPENSRLIVDLVASGTTSAKVALFNAPELAFHKFPTPGEQAKAIGLREAMHVIPVLALALVVVLFAASRTVTKDYESLHRWMAESSGAEYKLKNET
jgi:MFS family permease